MGKNLVSQLIKIVVFGLFWSVIGFLLASLLVNRTSYNLKDILFIEGILLVAISVLSSLGDNSTGLSLNGMGMNNPSLKASVNLEITRKEREINPIKQTLLFGLSSLSLIIGGLLLILLNFVI
ncbi:MAG: hypothetical protein ACRC68_10725 [Clostridium sp.]